MFGFQRAIPAAVMVRETPWDQTPHVMITHGHTWARIFVCSSYKYFLGACMDARNWPLATGGICGCGNHDEYSSVGISDVSGRVPTPVMGREMLEALLLNKTSHGHMSLCRQENHQNKKIIVKCSTRAHMANAHTSLCRQHIITKIKRF